VTWLKSVRAHVLIKGLVQGVSFRSSTRRMAVSLGLKGWVRNVDDDKVEAVFEGPVDNVKKIVEWCNRGPFSAKVDNVETEISNYTGEFESFEVIV
jgi:acylphosphatase